MANEVTIVVTGENKAGGAFKTAEGQAGGLGDRLIRLGDIAKTAGIAIATDLVRRGLEKLVSFIGESITAASDLGESINAVDRIFGASATFVKKWGEQNAASLGLSTRAFNQLATPLGALLKNAGLRLQDVGVWTTKLTERAADMASVFNTDVADALMAIQAGLRGESDPLETFGVSLSAAKVELQALADTGKKSAKDLTETELATARLNLIMGQTASVAGDFRSTSDGLANSQRILAAEQENLQAQIGEKLLPLTLEWTRAKGKLVDMITDRVLPALGDPRVGEFADKIKDKIAPVITEIIVPALKTFWEWLDEKVRPALEDVRDSADEVAAQFGDTAKQVATLRVEATRLWERLGPLQGSFKALGLVIIGAMLGPLMVIQALSFYLSNVARGLQTIIDLARRAASELNKVKPVRAFGGLSAFFEHGGVVGAATGGIHSRMTMVGEHGRELLELPPGTRVHSNPDTERIMAGGGGGGRLVVEVIPAPSLGNDLSNAIVENLIYRVRTGAGGSVQSFLGSGN